MSDANKSPTGQGNETFNEDFDFGEGDTQSHPIETSRPNKHHKKVIVLIFMIVVCTVLFIGYRIYSPKLLGLKNPLNTSAFTKKPTSVVTAPPSVYAPKNVQETPEEIKKQADEFEAALASIKPPATAVPATEPKIVAPVPPMPAVSNTPEAEKSMILEKGETEKLQEGLNTLNNQIDSILSQIKYLDAYSREVSDNLNKLNESINTMDNRILTLSNTTSTLSKDVGAVKSEMGQVRNVLREDGLDMSPSPTSKSKQGRLEKESSVVIAEPEYTVHAVVPGRAWLKSTTGQIVTVAEGDSIGNYGKILVIDAANGVVLTSSGVAFR